MANYPKELEDLIQEYLTDGIITEKERRVLLNKAQELGLNVDEVDLYIDAQEQKADQANRAAAAKVKGRLCPYCGASIPQLADKCPSCNQGISVQADDELEDIINHLEEALIDFKSGKDFARNKANVERYVRKAEMYYGSNPKIKILLEQVKEESALAESKAKKKATWNTVGKILTYNKWLTAGVILALIGGIGALVTSIADALHGADPTTDQAACIKLMQAAIKDGDLATAQSYYDAFSGRKYDLEDILKPAYSSAISSEISNGNLDLAMDYAQKSKINAANDANVKKLVNALIKAGRYEDALVASGFHGTYYDDESYEILSSCVMDMEEKGQKDKAKRFINAHYSWNQYSSNQDGVKKKLLNLLNN